MKIRNCIKYIRGSSSRKQKFFDCVEQVGLASDRTDLRQDVPIRWNSTYMMLESALFYHRSLTNLGLSNPSFNCCPSLEEWDKLEKILKFLGYFYKVTCLFSDSYMKEFQKKRSWKIYWWRKVWTEVGVHMGWVGSVFRLNWNRTAQKIIEKIQTERPTNWAQIELTQPVYNFGRIGRVNRVGLGPKLRFWF